MVSRASPRTAQQCQRDTINVARLVSRLENKLQQDQSGQQAASSSVISTGNGVRSGDGDGAALSAMLAYRATMSAEGHTVHALRSLLLSRLQNIREGKRLLQQNDGIDAVEANVRRKLSHRLDSLASGFKALHTSSPHPAESLADLYHPPDLQHLRPQRPQPIVSVIAPTDDTDMLQDTTYKPSPEASPNDIVATVKATHPAVDRADPLHKVKGKDPKLRRDAPSSSVMSHHRAEQDAITDELLQMSSLLKQNSVTFSDMLLEDRKAMEIAEQKLDTNHDGMVKQRVRLKDYTKKAGVSTWFVLIAVSGVAAAWFMMFGIMRIF